MKEGLTFGTSIRKDIFVFKYTINFMNYKDINKLKDSDDKMMKLINGR